MLITHALTVAAFAVLAVSIIMCAYYLNQIRDLLREIRDTQKRQAQRFGVPMK